MLLDQPPSPDLFARADDLNNRFDGQAAQAILHAAFDDPWIERTALVSSFGAESVVLLHMVSEIAPETPVLFLDTEMLFPETLEYQREVADRLRLNVRVVTPDREEVFADDVNGRLHTTQPDACCALRKSRPLERALRGFDAWITGRKRHQSGTRAALPVFEAQSGKLKINPLAEWSREDVAHYIARHGLPRHPLVTRGFPSLGCAPCTTRVADGEDARAGRWRGRDKMECGIHFENGRMIREAAE